MESHIRFKVYNITYYNWLKIRNFNLINEYIIKYNNHIGQFHIKQFTSHFDKQQSTSKQKKGKYITTLVLS